MTAGKKEVSSSECSPADAPKANNGGFRLDFNFGKRGRKERLAYLKRHYRIKEEGVAQLRLDQAQTSKNFKDSLRRLREYSEERFPMKKESA